MAIALVAARALAEEITVYPQYARSSPKTMMRRFPDPVLMCFGAAPAYSVAAGKHSVSFVPTSFPDIGREWLPKHVNLRAPRTSYLRCQSVGSS